MAIPEEIASEAPLESSEGELRSLKWPPRRLQKGSSRPLEISFNILSLLMVALVVIYIGFLLHNNGRDIESLSSMWGFVHEFSLLGPTVVPLMFAFVIGRAIRSFAHWRLQEGERIWLLDSLLGSTTMTSTVTTMIDSKRIGFFGVALVIVWSLSPLGGQATLRVLLQRPEEISSLTNLPYLNNNVPFPQRYMAAGISGQQIPVNTLFLGSLGATDQVKNSTLDTWGNVKIPMIESLSQYPRPESKEWIFLDQDQNDLVYSALVGVPVANVSQNDRSTFTLETSYLKIDCADLRNFAGNVSQVTNSRRAGCDEGEGSSSSRCNYRFKWGEVSTVPYPQGMKNSSRQNERCVDPQVAARQLLYWSYNQGGGTTSYTLANCSLTTSHVDVRIDCSGWNCEPTAIRPAASRGSLSANTTFFDGCPQENSNIWRWFFRYFETVAESGGGGVGSNTIVQSYLVNPELGLNASAAFSLPPVYQVGRELLSTRLSQLLNTYWWAMIGNEPLFLGHPENYDGLTQWSTGSPEFPQNDNYVFSQTQATVYTRVRTLRYDKGWVAVLILSTFVLLLAAIAGLALDLKRWVPKLLMNVSTMTRGNPNFGVPTGGGALPDEARAKLLADVRVRFGDAETRGGSHDLVIGDCVEYGGRVAKLTKGKLYS